MALNFLNNGYFAAKVGIGTESPAAKLHVNPTTTDEIAIAINGTQNYSAGEFQRIAAGDASSINRLSIGFGYDSPTDWAIRYSSYGRHEFYTGNDWGNAANTEKMVITSSGSVGIGTGSPGTKLEVVADVAKGVLINRTYTTSSQSLANVRAYYGLAITPLRGGTGGLYFTNYDADTPIIQSVNTSDVAQFLLLNPLGGNVGIGTTSPTQKLHVAGNARVTGAYYDSNNSPGTANQVLVSTVTGTDWVDGSGSSIIGGPYLPLTAGSSYPLTGILYLGNVASDQKIQFQRTGGNVYSIEHDSAQLYFYNRTTTESPLIIQNDGDVLMNAGNVGIGTSTLNAISGTNPTLTLGGTGISGGLILQRAGTDKARLYENAGNMVHQGMTGVGHHFYVNAATQAMVINSSGNVGILTSSMLNTGTSRGSLTIGGSVAGTINIGNGSINFGIYATTTESSIYSLEVMKFSVGSGFPEKMRITSGGNVGIGTTSPGEKLDVAGNVLITAALLSNQENTDVDTGTETVASVAIATYTAAFFDFVIKKTTNVRSGTVYACHDGTNVEFTETSTQDLGDTSDVTLSVDISGGNMRLLATVTSDDWSVKSLIRAI